MRFFLSILFLVATSISFAQTNLLDSSSWTVGTGNVGIFSGQGTDEENVRELGSDPYGSSSILWKASPDNVSSYVNGGWKANPNILIDHTKSYRFAVWIKMTNSFEGRLDFGVYVYDTSSNNGTFDLENNISSSGMCYQGDIPVLDKWYLMVGYVHASNYTGTINSGGAYDPVTGEKVSNITGFKDFKFPANASSISPRIYNAWSSNPLDAKYLFGPTLYEVNGSEPTIETLLNPNSGGTGESVWNTNGSTINYTAGNVGIGATNPNSLLTIGYTNSTNQLAFKRADGIEYFTINTNTSAQAIFTNKTGSGDYNFQTNIGGSGVTSALFIEGTNGSIGIGTTNPDSKLAVNGKIHAQEVKVDMIGWPDYVFAKDYTLPTLEEVEKHIQEKGHLINIPSAVEVEANGIELGEMNKLLLEKIEELTLYVIGLQKEIQQLKIRNHRIIELDKKITNLLSKK